MATTRYDELLEQVEAFHRAHPEVWEMFKRFTFDRIEKGFRNYSAYAVFERIRWEIDAVGGDGVTVFKLNNNYRPFYARAFMNQYPEHQGFFRIRVQTSKAKPATGLPELRPADFPNLF